MNGSQLQRQQQQESLRQQRQTCETKERGREKGDGNVGMKIAKLSPHTHTRSRLSLTLGLPPSTFLSVERVTLHVTSLSPSPSLFSAKSKATSTIAAPESHVCRPSVTEAGYHSETTAAAGISSSLVSRRRLASLADCILHPLSLSLSSHRFSLLFLLLCLRLPNPKTIGSGRQADRQTRGLRASNAGNDDDDGEM